MPLIDLSDRFTKVELGTAAVIALGNLLVFIGIVTPAWQVADDTDVNRHVESGLWLYCQTGAQCWYIFSDNLINYYERVDVCRFLLIGDCRKKLLRTPYFFGWHYAVLILNLIALAASTLSLVALALGHWKPHRLRTSTVLFTVLNATALLCLLIGLAVFMTNAEMLESMYLIGAKNTFEKHYGYSFYLTFLGLMCWLFALFAACLLITWVFVTGHRPSHYVEAGQFDADNRQTAAGNQLYAPQSIQHPSHYHKNPALARAQSPAVASLNPSQNSEFQQTTRYFLSY